MSQRGLSDDLWLTSKKDKLKIRLVAFQAKAPISRNEEKSEFCCRLSVLAIGTQALYCCFLVRNVYSAGKSAC